MLDTIGFVWEARRRAVPRTKWDDRFEDLQLFKKKYGHSNVPANSIEFSTLARWVILQRNLYRQGKLLEWKQKLLEKEGFHWGKSVGEVTSWEDQVAKLTRFKEQNGHCWVSMTDKNHKDLGRWLTATRARKLAGQLSFERFSQLARLGVVWHRNRKSNYTISQSLREMFPEFSSRTREAIVQKEYWKKMLGLLRNHIKKYGNGDFKEHPPLNAELELWAKVQRALFASGKMNHEHEVLLNKTGFFWVYDEEEMHRFFKGKFGSKARNRPASLVPELDKFRKHKNRSDDAWGKKFAELHDFKKSYGHIKIPSSDPAWKSLYQWLFKQRKLFQKEELERERARVLKEFGALGFSTPRDRA